MLVAAAATTVVSLASPVASYAAGTPSASSGADAGKPSQAQPSQAQFKKLDEVIKKHHALGATGVSSEQVVALPSGTSAAEKSKLSAEIPAGMDVTVKISQFTKDALDKTGKTITAKKWHADADKYAVVFAYDAKEDKIKVDTDAPASVTKSLLDANPGKIAVHQTRIEVQRNRFDDWSPFSGGAAIVNATKNGNCTAGVSVKNVYTGARKMMTAGHCGSVGNTFLQRYSNGGWGPYFGTMESRYDNIDSALIGGASYGGYIWTGGYTASTSSMWVDGGNNPWVGAKVCVSGATSLNHCGHPVTNTNVTYSPKSPEGTNIEGGNGFSYDQGGTMQPWGWQWGTATEPGDSGAPVFYHDSYNLKATITGTHSLRVWGECGCWKMIGVKIGSTLSAWRLDLVRYWE